MLMRVSCAALVLLKHPDGRFALLGSRTKYAATGARVLTPIGGAIEITPTGKAYLVDSLGVYGDSFEGNDLRFYLQEDRLNDFREWFLQGSGIELHPAQREFSEELGPDEHDILTPAEANRCNLTLRGRHELNQRSARRGQERVRTHYFLDFYSASFVPDGVMTKLIDAGARADSLLEFVHASEITQGRTGGGATILELSRLLLNL